MDTNAIKDVVDAEVQALQVQTTLAAVRIEDQASYDLAVKARQSAKAYLKNASDWFEGIVKPAHEAWKNAVAKRTLVMDPVESQIKRIDAALREWDAAQERIRLAEQRRLEREAAEQAEEQRLADAIHLEEVGAPEAAEALLNTPAPVTAVVQAAPTYDRGKAVTYRDNWGGEVVDINALIVAAAENPMYRSLLMINQPALTQMARAMKENLNIPGVKATNNRVIASGRG